MYLYELKFSLDHAVPDMDAQVLNSSGLIMISSAPAYLFEVSRERDGCRANVANQLTAARIGTGREILALCGEIYKDFRYAIIIKIQQNGNTF